MFKHALGFVLFALVFAILGGWLFSTMGWGTFETGAMVFVAVFVVALIGVQTRSTFGCLLVVLFGLIAATVIWWAL